MSIHPDLRDQAYQFFVEEAPELLQILETELLTLNQDRSAAKVHSLMRAAHTIKGSASSVGLEPIATLAHRLENIFKVLYHDLELDTELQSQILRAFDCLRLPLMEQINTGHFDVEQALANAAPVFVQIEDQFGDALLQADQSYIPSSTDMGVDIVASIFEVDVVDGLKQLSNVLAAPQNYEVAGELRAQAEVFAGFAELLNLPGFRAIAVAAQQAVTLHPQRALEITQIALADFEQGRQAVLAGDRTQGGQPSAALLAFAGLPEETAEIQSKAPENTEAKLFLEQPAQIAPEAVDIAESLGSQRLDAFSSAAPTSLSAAELDDLNQAMQTLGNLFAPLTSDQDPATSGESSDSLFGDQVSSNADLDIDVNSIEYTTDAILPTKANYSGGTLVPQSTGEVIPLHPTSALAYSGHSLNPASLSQVTDSSEAPALTKLTVRVDSERLDRMNNLVGELAINRDGLALQNEQLQAALRGLLNRFEKFQAVVDLVQDISDRMLIASESNAVSDSVVNETTKTSSGRKNKSDNRRGKAKSNSLATLLQPVTSSKADLTEEIELKSEFDPLEMDHYSALHNQFQEIQENIMQLQEVVNDVSLFARQSDQILEKQQYILAHLRDELTWARMVPLGEILNRLPRWMHDLSATHHKPVNLQLIGTDVLVDKAILSKLYTPLLHLLRNAFDHGVESPEIRRQRGKPETGQITIHAYQKGNQTIIEVKDDGQGINLDRIRARAFELGWLSLEQLAVTPSSQLLELIFAAGFSTSAQTNELSGRGVGLDVVRSQLQAIKSSITVASTPEQGTTFSLYLPLILTSMKLVICLVGATAIAFPLDMIEEVITPQPEQLKRSGQQQFLFWHEQIIPTYPVADLLHYTCPLPESISSKALTMSTAQDGTAPMLVLRQSQQFFALEVSRLVAEQELVIKPFGTAMAPPRYMYGCTILGDGSLVPILDGAALLAARQNHINPSEPPVVQSFQSATVLVVDDATTLRRTLALSLERAGMRILQASDGWNAIDQLQHAKVDLIVCDVEMPKMNGFEFLSYRRQDPKLAAIPIVILTSRSNNKHRWLAMRLGATAYFTKPYLEQEFLSSIQAIMQLNRQD